MPSRLSPLFAPILLSPSLSLLLRLLTLWRSPGGYLKFNKQRRHWPANVSFSSVLHFLPYSAPYTSRGDTDSMCCNLTPKYLFVENIEYLRLLFFSVSVLGVCLSLVYRCHNGRMKWYHPGTLPYSYPLLFAVMNSQQHYWVHLMWPVANYLSSWNYIARHKTILAAVAHSYYLASSLH